MPLTGFEDQENHRIPFASVLCFHQLTASDDLRVSLIRAQFGGFREPRHWGFYNAVADLDVHRWSGKTVADMSVGPDTVEIAPATGKPTFQDFAYRVFYHWTSHYLHRTIVGLAWPRSIGWPRQFHGPQWRHQGHGDMASFKVAT